jgi:hypothetical protein
MNQPVVDPRPRRTVSKEKMEIFILGANATCDMIDEGGATKFSHETHPIFHGLPWSRRLESSPHAHGVSGFRGTEV